jgi:hypothetical protein
MPKEYEIKVENKLKKEKRGINVYHKATKSAHIISYDSSIKIPLQTAAEGDFLHLSVLSGPGHLWNECFITLPSWADFEFLSEGMVAVSHSGERIVVKVRPGPPTWQLKMTLPPTATALTRSADIVIITDESQVGVPFQGV